MKNQTLDGQASQRVGDVGLVRIHCVGTLFTDVQEWRHAHVLHGVEAPSLIPRFLEREGIGVFAYKF